MARHPFLGLPTAGNDTISGGFGDDILAGGAGDDVLSGGEDNDLFFEGGLTWEWDDAPGFVHGHDYDLGAGSDSFHGGQGDDALAYVGAQGPVLLDFRAGTATLGSDIDRFESIEAFFLTDRDDTVRGVWDEACFGGRGLDSVELSSGFGAALSVSVRNKGVAWQLSLTVITAELRSVEAVTGAATISNDIRLSIDGARIVGGGVGDVLVARGAGTRIEGLGGDDRIVTWSGAAKGDLVRAWGGSGDDLLRSDIADVASKSLWGGSGSDRIEAGSGQLDLYGGDGADLLVLDGSDGQRKRLYGGSGDDAIVASGGRLVVFGDDGDDRVTLRSYDNPSRVVYGGAGFDSLVLLPVLPEGARIEDRRILLGDIELLTLRGVEHLVLVRASEMIVAADVWFSLDLGERDDTLVGLRAGRSYDGGDGVDLLDMSATAAAVTVDLYLGTGQVGEAGSRVTGFESVVGSGTHANILSASGLGSTLIGGAANDRLYGFGGSDHLYGGGGDDLLTDARHADNPYEANGAGVLFGGDGNDTLDSAPGILHGDGGNDVLTLRYDPVLYTPYEAHGDDGDDTLSGWGTFYGGSGNDTFLDMLGTSYGGDGDDVFHILGGTAYGGEGHDRAYLTGGSYEFTGGATGMPSVEEIHMDDSRRDVYVTGDRLNLTLADGREYVTINCMGLVIDTRGSGDHVIVHGAGHNIRTGLGADTVHQQETGLFGTALTRIDTGEGNDSVLLERGNAHVLLGDGDDIGVGDGIVNTTLEGGEGNDTFLIWSGAYYVIDAGAGDDSVDCLGAFASVALGDGNDSIEASAGNGHLMIVDAGAGNDEVVAANGPLQIDLGSGNDRLTLLGDGTVAATGTGRDRVQVTRTTGNALVVLTDIELGADLFGVKGMSGFGDAVLTQEDDAAVAAFTLSGGTLLTVRFFGLDVADLTGALWLGG